MAATLVASGLAAGHAETTLFSDVSFVLAPGEVLGVVGINGAGKSTLLQLLAGLREPSAGTVSRTPADATVGYLPQDRGGEPGETIAAFLARRTGVAAAEAAMNAAAVALATAAAGADEVYSSALETWLELGGADLAERIPPVCADLGLDVDLDTAMTGLSGGQAARVGLVALLLSRFDVVLLDEPTNDLDLRGLQRLEDFVQNLRVGVAIVSHDREFLSRCVTSVLELDLAQGKTRFVAGGYQAYLAEREVERRHEREAYEQYEQRREGLVERGRTQRAWMDKGVANARRKAPDNDKIGRKFRSEASEKQAAKARQTDRMLSRLTEVVEPRKEWQLQMQIGAAPRSGAVVAIANGAVVRRGGFTLGPVDLTIDWADRVVITGDNGAGKSSLIALLLGRLPVEQGSATLGRGVVIGEIDQARAQLSTALPLARVVGDLLPELDDAGVRTLLAKFGLRGRHANRPADSLSPGERTRAALALLQGRQVNLLVLDEPTNHLDLPAIEQLESALDSFDGTVLLISHDRQLLAGVRSTRRLVVAAGHVSEI
jgi:ATPase subunit of ABC transporter with duplicated ATPase domains